MKKKRWAIGKTAGGIAKLRRPAQSVLAPGAKYSDIRCGGMSTTTISEALLSQSWEVSRKCRADSLFNEIRNVSAHGRTSNEPGEKAHSLTMSALHRRDQYGRG